MAQPAMRNVEERNALVLANLPLARWALRRRRGLARTRLDPDDAYQEACVGLLRAAERWNPARGAFSTVAYLSCRSRLHRAAQLATLVHLPEYQYYPDQEHGCVRFRQEVAQALAAVFSLDRRTADNPALAGPDPALGALEDQEEHRYLRSRIVRLPLVCQVVLRLRFWDGLTRPLVGCRLGLPQWVVRRLEQQALIALRSALGKDYLDARR